MARRIWLGRYGSQVFCCSGQPRTCHNFRLLEAEESEFHTRALIVATDEINRVLDRIRAEEPDRHLALLDTDFGLVFAWADPMEAPPPEDLGEYVTADSPEAEVRRVLGIRGEEEAAAY